jgi:tetratricopeptide (TPR) repeat protein
MPSPTDDDTHSIARGHLDVGRRFEQAGATEKALTAYRAALATARLPIEKAEATLRMARVHRTRAAWDDAIRDAREAVRLANLAGDDDLVAEAMNVEVGVYQLRGEFAAGHALAELALSRTDAPRIRGMLLQNRGAMAARSRDFAAAERFFAESIDAFRAAGYDRGVAIALNNAAAAALDADDPERALAQARESADVALRAQAFDVVVLALQNQGEALVGLDRLEEAESMLGGTLGHFASSGDMLRQAECLEILGGLHARREGGRPTAIRCLERAVSLANGVGDRVLCERLAGRLSRLGDAAGEQAAR